MSEHLKKKTNQEIERKEEDSYENLRWKGSFEEYLEIIKENPNVIRNAFQRMSDMIEEQGSERYEDAKKEIITYNFFQDNFHDGKDAVFGLDVPLMKLVHVLKAAAQGFGPVKRVILLHGPVGSAKSTICRLLKKGLERYSRQSTGALYTFDWVDKDGQFEEIFGKDVRRFPNPMNEEPLLLLPLQKREEFLSALETSHLDWSLGVEGDLCPPSQMIFKGLLEHYKGDSEKILNHIEVRRFVISEKDRLGIGTFQPKDEKNQDSTELTGDINFRKIAQYGSDSDPRAFNFDGEFNIANRGMIEFVEMLKLDVAFLYDLLTASQEHMIKPKKFAQTSIDEVIIGHTNEPEYQKFIDNQFMEALRDRTVKIDIPYITKWDDETKIYKRDFNQKRLKNISLAPHSLELMAMWSVLTRLEEFRKEGFNIDRMKKLKLYNGENVDGFNQSNVKEMRKKAQKEGLKGISPRYIQDRISSALVLSQQLGNKSITPFDLLRELESGLRHHSLISDDKIKDDYIKLIKLVEKEYEKIIEDEVRQCFSSDDKGLEALGLKYVQDVALFCQNKNCDEKFMQSIEIKIGINEIKKNDFRQEIFNYLEASGKEIQNFDFTANNKLKEALEKKLFEEQKEELKLLTLKPNSKTPEMKEKIRMTEERLIKKFHYDEISAPFVLNYVTEIISKKTQTTSPEKS